MEIFKFNKEFWKILGFEWNFSDFIKDFLKIWRKKIKKNWKNNIKNKYLNKIYNTRFAGPNKFSQNFLLVLY
jgi:hypothetical protein